ncbi:MAG TPA: hypothetical protein VJJ23_06720 [Candidatus Nanoarchaeia archaeon]|nr:hypothetical protein [Candidatus Nanoarchaeia archaeon]
MGKGQIDMIGITVVLLLIIIIGIVALRFSITKVESNQDNTLNSIKANNLVNALVKASSCDSNLKEAMKNCCENSDFCGQNACDFLEKEAKSIFDKTITSNYLLEIKNEDKSCFNLGKCEQGISSSPYFVNELEIKLKICEK